MKGWAFYEEFPSSYKKRHRRDSCGTVVAVCRENGCWVDKHAGRLWEAFGAVLDQPNSDVCATSASEGYLRGKCRRITEKRAREIHPALFLRLDEGE